VLLIHDAAQGEELIDAAAHLGDGLPARVIPVAVNEVTQVGLEALAAAFAYGAAGVALLMRAKPRHDVSGLRRTVATSNALLEALGYGPGLVRTIETDDPDALIATLRGLPTGCATPRPSQFLALGAKRDVLKLAVRELHRAGPSPVDTVALPAGAPFGRVVVRTDGCTLCLSCVSACPTGALGDDKERPLLRFDESLCVQCGLCRATCPEKVITLDPRLHFPAFGAGHVTLKEEEPFCCTRCSKPFGTRSAIERVIAKLEGSHWMFGGEQGRARLEMLKMCDDCRIIAATEASLDPYGAPPRPAPKTSDDYLREREERERRMKERIEKGEV
jgi:ferredoxin